MARYIYMSDIGWCHSPESIQLCPWSNFFGQTCTPGAKELQIFGVKYLWQLCPHGFNSI
jgi:hypothetical protein